MTPAARPRFRTDLVAEPIQEGGKLFVDVFDPDSGTGFRFYEVEYSLACAMDGERDVAGLVRWAKEELGVEPSAGELATVINTLGDLGYLAGEPGVDVGDLAMGVVTGPSLAPPQVEEFELGTAGGAVAAPVDLPRVDVELGQAGGVASPRQIVDDFGAGPELGRDDFPQPPSAAIPVAQLRPSTIPDSDHDGPTDLPRPVPLAGGDEDVSTDLSDHLAISASDVKEAVRQSKVMSAVEMPADIAEVLAAAEAQNEARAAAEKAAARAAAEAADKAAADKAAADAAEKATAEKAAADKAAAAQAVADKAAQAVVREPTSLDKATKPVDKAADKATKPVDKAADKAADKATKPVDKATKPVDKAAAKVTKPLDPTAKLSDKPVTKTTKPIATPPVVIAEEPRTSRALIALLIIVILLAGTYLVWTQLLKKPLPWEKTAPVATAPQPRGPVTPPAPPAPPAPSSILADMPGTTTVVGATRQGVIVQIVADGSTVAAGDELARFAANLGLTKSMTTGKQRLDVDLPKVIADLTAKRDAAVAASKPPAAVKVQQDKLDKQLQVKASLEAEVASLAQQLDAYVVKAPLAGMVKTQVAKGATVTLEQPLASITSPTTLRATFTVSGGKSYGVGDAAHVMLKSSPGRGIDCKVAAFDGSSVTVECPNGAGALAGTEITLE